MHVMILENVELQSNILFVITFYSQLNHCSESVLTIYYFFVLFFIKLLMRRCSIAARLSLLPTKHEQRRSKVLEEKFPCQVPMPNNLISLK